MFRPQREFFEALAKGQRPEALFITCSDSRINPNLLTQTRPGELFILRNAGNIVPPYGAVQGGEEATIEYAIAVLGVRDIIVCGHSHCGAMNALIQDREPALPAVARWLKHAEATRQIMAQNYGHLTDGPRLTAAVEENVLVQLENLRTHPTVAAALNRKALHLHGWVYKLETGEVFTFEPGRGQFIPLVTERPASEATAPVGEASLTI
ncbi:MAG TPA: carbonic anhydrase [Polyangiaceae bacterium]|nr:carbonic anhydrase [Polyangiaceae bacterium]